MKKYSVFEIANWFLNKEPTTPRKLQKLVYYAEAWSNALCDEGLINDTYFEAGIHGPISPKLQQKYKNYGWKDINLKEPSNIKDPKVLKLLESVWITYGALREHELEVISCKENPWRNARVGCSEGKHCKEKISKHDMKVYYKSVYLGD